MEPLDRAMSNDLKTVKADVKDLNLQVRALPSKRWLLMMLLAAAAAFSAGLLIGVRWIS
jgi:hypothetical protein